MPRERALLLPGFCLSVRKARVRPSSSAARNSYALTSSSTAGRRLRTAFLQANLRESSSRAVDARRPLAHSGERR